jgi:hypothetical protein
VTDSDPGTRYRLPLLIAGTVIGLSIAGLGLIERGQDEISTLPPGIIAKVGETLIGTGQYVALLDDLAADKRNPLTDQDQEFALQRLIDEELLVQRGVELGLAENAPTIRKAVAAEVISHVVTATRATPPDEATLREFYASASAYFSSPGRLRLHWWMQKSSSLEIEALAWETIHGLQRGDEPQVLLRQYGFERVADFPDSLLPMNKLLDYIGPVLLDRVTSILPGQYTDPIKDEQGLHVLFVAERASESVPNFDAIRSEVEREYLHRASDTALREYIDWLRSRTPVTVSDSEQE